MSRPTFRSESIPQPGTISVFPAAIEAGNRETAIRASLQISGIRAGVVGMSSAPFWTGLITTASPLPLRSQKMVRFPRVGSPQST